MAHPSGLPAPDPSPDPALTYEQARAQLEEVVRALEAGGVPLEESLQLWERGETLAAVCRERLEGARARLEAARPGDAAPAD